MKEEWHVFVKATDQHEWMLLCVCGTSIALSAIVFALADNSVRTPVAFKIERIFVYGE